MISSDSLLRVADGDDWDSATAAAAAGDAAEELPVEDAPGGGVDESLFARAGLGAGGGDGGDDDELAAAPVWTESLLAELPPAGSLGLAALGAEGLPPLPPTAAEAAAAAAATAAAASAKPPPPPP